MNPFDELYKIDHKLKTLCPFDDHNELLALNELKAKTEAKINALFNLYNY